MMLDTWEKNKELSGKSDNVIKQPEIRLFRIHLDICLIFAFQISRIPSLPDIWKI